MAIAQIKGKRTAMRQRRMAMLRTLFLMIFPNAAKRRLRCRFILFFYHQLIDRYFLKVGDRCCPVRTIGVATRDRPGDGIVNGLDPRIKIDEVPDGDTDGPHPDPSYHPLKGYHLIRTDLFPGILI